MLLQQEKERHKINKEQLKEQGIMYELQAMIDSQTKLFELKKENIVESRGKSDEFKRTLEMQKKDEELKKYNLETEVTGMAGQYKKDSDLKYNQWVSTTKYTNSEENEKRRHELVAKENQALIKGKEAHKQTETDLLAAAKAAYESFTAA